MKYARVMLLSNAAMAKKYCMNSNSRLEHRN